MILVWKDVTSFCRHLHDMRVFWQLNKTNRQSRWKKVRDMPEMHDIQPQKNVQDSSRLFNSRGELIVVPIWKIEPPKGIEN